jgi:hypothetical protein
LVSQPDVRITGFGAAFDLWAGWTLSSGLVLGPALSVATQRSSSSSVSGGSKLPAAATHALFGAFLDAYPNPRSGQHFGGLLAIAALRQTTDDENDQTAFDGTGVGLQVFAGFDAWLAREWSLGALLRVGGTVTQGRETISNQSVGKQGTAYSVSLLATVLHH